MFWKKLKERLTKGSLLYVDVVFNKLNKTYTYICPSNFKYKLGDVIKIYNDDNEPVEVTLLSNLYHKSASIKIYKVINVCAEEPQKVLNNSQVEKEATSKSELVKEKAKTDPNKCLCIDVRFLDSVKIYTYICPPEFKYKKGNLVTIYNVLNEPEDVILVKDPYYLKKENCKFFRVCKEASKYEKKIDEKKKIEILNYKKPQIKNFHNNQRPIKLYVDIQFVDKGKVYTYLCPPNFDYKENDTIMVYNYRNKMENAILVRGPYLSKEKDNCKELIIHKYVYVNHCWNCKHGISSETNELCTWPNCGFYICSFCGCCSTYPEKRDKPHKWENWYL